MIQYKKITEQKEHYMTYERDLSFLKKALSYYRLSVHIIKDFEEHFEKVDKGIREFLGLDDLYEKTVDFMKPILEPNTIFLIIDDFFTNYILLQLPDTQNTEYLIIGPYSSQNFSKNEFLSAINKYQIPATLYDILFEYYSTIPVVTDMQSINVLINTFGEIIWNGENNFTHKTFQHSFAQSYLGTIPEHILTGVSASNDVSYRMQLLEERYETENQFLKYVSLGNYTKALATLTGINELILENRASVRIRDYKNYAIILNTLLRKAAEQGSVHPIHIDNLSSAFAKKIEEINSLEQGIRLYKEMLRKYCLLVKKYSTKEYSFFIQKVIARIEADFTADQSLKTHAKLLNINPSYLSSLFKKETGMTLTEYVNQRRIEHSILLLNSTNMQIQTVALNCGIPDINYFTRLFKKHVGKTPSEYKRLLT